MFDGVLWIAGGVVSPTVTVNEADAVAPATSVTVQTTVLRPSGKVEPDAGAHTGVMAPSSASNPVAAYVTTAPAGLVASTDGMLAGTVTVGAVLNTVTLKEPEAVRPPESVTVQLTVVVPIAKVEPEAGAQAAAIGPSWVSLPMAE